MALPDPMINLQDLTHTTRSAAAVEGKKSQRRRLFLFPLISTWRKILCAPRLCLFLSRREILGPTLVRFLLTSSQSRLTGRGARFSFGSVLCGSRQCKECRSNCYRYDAFHLSAPLGVRTSSRKDCRTRTARKWVRSFTLNFRLFRSDGLIAVAVSLRSARPDGSRKMDRGESDLARREVVLSPLRQGSSKNLVW